MAWAPVVVAGLLETVLAVAFAVSGAASPGLLSVAPKSLPVGSAHAACTGIGAAGTAVAG